MSGYTAIDHGFPEHRKVMELHDRSFRFHITALDYCSRNMTDGHVSARAVKVIAAIIETNSKRWTAELVKAGLWKHDDAGDGFWINDYLKHNPSGESMKKLRDKRRVAGLKGAEARWSSDDGKSNGTSDGKSHGKEQMPEVVKGRELPLELKGSSRPPGRPNCLPVNDHLIERLMGLCGSSADEGTEAVLRSYACQLPESSLAKVIESTATKAPADRSRYANGALQSEIEERQAA